MTEKELSQFGLLDEFSITELEQRLEFEAWCDWSCSHTDTTCTHNSICPPVENAVCGGGGGGGGDPLPDELCIDNRI